MIACAACQAENPAGFKFCGQCGAALAVPMTQAEERKVVTTLFCDLVAFTAMSEQADPEDIDLLLRRYHALARRTIDAHGGTVEKFIGDAVVGVFGVPAAHEDDPERAVRAGLRIVEALEGMTRPDGSPLQVRVGVNTGEALVRLDVTPGSGAGFLTGDAVNTAARLQTAAPPSRVAVGVLTHELSARAIDYEELQPVVAKGKAEPVAAWLAARPLARTIMRTAALTTTPFLGREDEVAALQEALRQASRAREGRFVLLVGEPGIGKSRLVLEFARTLEAAPGLVTWRQGRCLPYGEGVAFWALGEVVKAQAGILDSDDVAAVEAKLAVMLPEGEDASWLRQRLRPLVGLEAAQATSEENFAAWTRFLELIAGSGPAVLVLEDLHWAGEAMLAFVEHLLSCDLEVPLLVVATARPELLRQHQGTLTAAADDRLRRITLPTLSQQDASLLIADLLNAELAADVRVQIVDLVGGNPLFAEQYVRLLLDGGLLVRAADGLHLAADTDLPLPESVQAVLAARLDTLPAGHKALLCDAAVIGETFWRGGVAALSGCGTSAVDEAMAALAARDLVRPVAASSMVGEPEYLFWHALARDVAYGQLPRRVRARKHEAAALWIERQTGGRRGEFADVLAHHYVTALELARASGLAESVDSLTDQAVRFLTLAGDRSLQLDVTAAERQYARALELLPTPSRGRSSLLVKWGEALYQLGNIFQSAGAFDQAAKHFRDQGDFRGAAAAMSLQSRSIFELGDPGGDDLSVEALALLRSDGPSPELVMVLEILTRYRVLTGDRRAAIDTAERALATAHELGAPVPARALHYRGLARCTLGDAGGLDDMRRALAVARDEGRAHEVATFLFNLGDALWLTEGAPSAPTTRRESADFAASRGQEGPAHRFSAGLANDCFWAGDWEASLGQSLVTERELERIGDLVFLAYLRADRSLLLAARGDAAAAETTVAWLQEQSSAGGEPDLLRRIALATSAVRHAQGDVAGVLSALGEYLRWVGRRADADSALSLPLATRLALSADDAALAEELAVHLVPSVPLYRYALATVEALLAEAHGEHETAAVGFASSAARWHEHGVLFEEAQALLGQGRCLVALGRAPRR